ncbi:coiled-coil domain-containing protein 65 [Arapaima gigas]
MPKGKKAAGGKLEGMSEEEKLLFRQQRALAEEDVKKQKEDILTHFLKDKLKKEERNSKVNLHKLTQQWRALLRKMRTEELRRDVDVLSQTFERVLDCKDSVIKCLMGDLEEAEQQSLRALHSNLQCMDQLLEVHRARLDSLEQQWNSELEELSKEFVSERDMIMSQHLADCTYLQDVSFAMEQYYKEVDNDAKQDFQSTRDDIKNRNIEEKHALRLHLEGAVEDLWRQFQQTLQAYNEATEDRQIAFETLRARDQSSAREIDTQMKKLQKMQDSVLALRAKLNSSQRENELAAQELRAAREEVTLQVQQLKDQLSHVRAGERMLLSNLTMHSNAAAKKLQGVIRKGEKLLRISEMCRKLETEQEKVLPFYATSLTAEEQSLGRANVMEAPSEELAKAMLDYTALNRFWQRYNKALLEKLSLEREQELLRQENNQLRLFLRQYLDGITVRDGILRNHNPLLMVSRPAFTSPTNTEAFRRRLTVIEAAHVVQHIL